MSGESVGRHANSGQDSSFRYTGRLVCRRPVGRTVQRVGGRLLVVEQLHRGWRVLLHISYASSATAAHAAQLALAADVARYVAALRVRYYFGSRATPLKRGSVRRTRFTELPSLESLTSGLYT